jgi:pullulanase
LNLNSGSQSFKVASEDWATVNFGGGSDVNVTLGTAKMLESPGADLKLQLDQAGQYKFDVDASDVAVPVLKVTKVE